MRLLALVLLVVVSSLVGATLHGLAGTGEARAPAPAMTRARRARRPLRAPHPPALRAARDSEPALAPARGGDAAPDPEPAAAPAASPTRTGTLTGTVVAAHGGRVLPGVTVFANSPLLPGPLAAVTDEQGRYRIAGLPGATYEVSFYHLNYTPLVREAIGVSTLDPTTLDVALDAGELTFTGRESTENTYIIDPGM